MRQLAKASQKIIFVQAQNGQMYLSTNLDYVAVNQNLN